MFQQVFVADPQKRLDITALGEHPIIHKYDRVFKYEGRPLEDWIGHSPTLEGWKTLDPDTIDRHVFRNLRTLLHDSDEGSLMRRLCSPQ